MEGMEKAEAIVASKRVSQWTEKDREWLSLLPPQELLAALLLVARLDASPYEESHGEDRGI